MTAAPVQPPLSASGRYIVDARGRRVGDHHGRRRRHGPALAKQVKGRGDFAAVEALAQVEAHAADGFQSRLRVAAGEAGEDQRHASGVEVFRHADAQDFQIQVAGQGFAGLGGQGQ